jgi:hypothetical protein
MSQQRIDALSECNYGHCSRQNLYEQKALQQTVSHIISFWYSTGNKGEIMFYVIAIIAAIFAMPAPSNKGGDIE